MRNFTAFIALPFLIITGYRFSKVHRMEEDFIYRNLNTVLANCTADDFTTGR